MILSSGLIPWKIRVASLNEDRRNTIAAIQGDNSPRAVRMEFITFLSFSLSPFYPCVLFLLDIVVIWYLLVI